MTFRGHFVSMRQRWVTWWLLNTIFQTWVPLLLSFPCVYITHHSKSWFMVVYSFPQWFVSTQNEVLSVSLLMRTLSLCLKLLSSVFEEQTSWGIFLSLELFLPLIANCSSQASAVGVILLQHVLGKKNLLKNACECPWRTSGLWGVFCGFITFSEKWEILGHGVMCQPLPLFMRFSYSLFPQTLTISFNPWCRGFQILS